MSRLVFAAGGTGGHVIPAQEVALYMEEHGMLCQFMAFGLVNNPFFNRKIWDFIEIPSAPTSCNPWKLCIWLYSTICGVKRAYGSLRDVDMVVGFGSYHTVPVLLAAWLRNIPIVLYEANSKPGRVIAFFSRLATWTGCCFKEVQIAGRKKLVRHPVRRSVMQQVVKEEALQYFHLPDNKPIMLVVGGSLGAGWFNSHMPDVLAAMAAYSVIHIAGADANVGAIKAAYDSFGITASVKHFEDHMEMAYSCADIAVSRAGASAVAELSWRDIPTVYVPYRYAKDDHQKCNALSAMRCSRAILVEETQPLSTLVSALHYVAHMERKPSNDYPLFGEELMQTLQELSS